MLAGPNGAGKSTFFETHLKALGLPFLNADMLARDTSLDAYSAAATIADIRDLLIRRREPFITETVFSDPVGEKVSVLVAAAEAGFDVTLIYIGIDSPALSERRVRTRVKAGGHDVPKEKLAGRYERSLDNLRRAIDVLPRVIVYDNSSFESPYSFVAEYHAATLVRRTESTIPAWFQSIDDTM